MGPNDHHHCHHGHHLMAPVVYYDHHNHYGYRQCCCASSTGITFTSFAVFLKETLLISLHGVLLLISTCPISSHPASISSHCKSFIITARSYFLFLCTLDVCTGHSHPGPPRMTELHTFFPAGKASFK